MKTGGGGGSEELTPQHLLMDAQLWLDPTHIITVKFQYYNSTFIDFNAGINNQ
jgi:hypothetical protein